MGPYGGDTGVEFTKLPGNQGVLVNGACTAYQTYIIFKFSDGISFKNKMINGHKYFVVKRVVGASDDVRFMDTYSTKFNTTTCDVITYNNPSSAGVDPGLLLYSGQSVVNSIIKPMMFDLTKMYGAGNEPDLNTCKAIFNMPYYPYHKLS